MATPQKKAKEIARSQSMPAGNPRRDRKSSTLPANTRPISSSSGEGFFTKLKRCLRIGSKGRYTVNTIQTETLQIQPIGVQHASEMGNGQSVVSRATSLRLARRAHVDKEDVILIHKSKIASGNGLFPNRSVSETIPEDGETVVHIVNGGAPLDTGQISGAEAIGVEDTDEAFEMDPGYETLDEIRKKVRLQAAAALRKSEKNSEIKTKNPSAESKTSNEKISKPNDLYEARNGFPPNENGNDSGITTPTTESPESGQDSQIRSVTSSMFSDTVLTEEGNQVDTIQPEEVTVRGGTMHRLNSCPAECMTKPQRDGQRYSSDSFLTKSLQDDTDTDLYANPQILFRKQSQMGKNKSVSASTIAMNGSQTTADTLSLPAGLGDKSVSDSDIKPRGSSVESDTVAPPLPDRKYLDFRASRTETDDEHSAENDCSTSTTISANQDLSQSATHDSVASISSIREVYTVSTDNLKTAEAESSGRTHEPGFSDGKSDRTVNTAEIEQGPVISTDQPREFVSHRSDESVDGLVLSFGKSDSVHNLDISPSNTDTCATLDTVALNETSSKKVSCEEMPKLSEEVIRSQNYKSEMKSGSPERTDCVESAAHATSAQNEKSQNILQEGIKSEPSLSQSEKNIPVKEMLKSSIDDENNEKGAQNTSLNLQTVKGCDGVFSDIIYGKESADREDQADSVNSDMLVQTQSINFTCRKTCLSESSDQSCDSDNVVVIKLHESTHEDCLTDKEGVLEEGVSDESIARLEEKAAMLQLGSHGKDSNPDSSKDKGQEIKPVASSQNDDNGGNSQEAVGAEASSGDGGQKVSSSTGVAEEPVPKPRHRRAKKKEEPIHMTLAEVMRPKEETTDDGWEADDDDYLELDEDVPEEDHTEGAAAASRQTTQNSTAAAHRAFLESMRQLKDCGWYWGPLSYNEAMSKLMNKPDGSFLVRDSSNENYILSLSFKCMGSVCHTRIEHNKGVFSFWSQPDSHGTSTIKEFIEQAVRFSHTGKFLYFLRPSGPGSPPIAIRLLYPVSRFCRVPSLQHMCRFLILRWVRRDHIDVLPVPEKVKNYLRENQYYVETLEEDD